MKVKWDDFRFYRYSKNLENEGKAGRILILPIFLKIWKMNVKPEVFTFYPCLKMWKMKVKGEDFRFYRYSKNVENEGSLF